eukprot:Polyplicarium_translucidae@DN2492_c0_g1_i3.p1
MGKTRQPEDGSHRCAKPPEADFGREDCARQAESGPFGRNASLFPWLSAFGGKQTAEKSGAAPTNPDPSRTPPHNKSLPSLTDSTRVSSAPCSNPPVPAIVPSGLPQAVGRPACDIVFANRLRVKLHRKLSAKCRCQFDVFEAEALPSSGCSASALFPVSPLPARFALKILDVASCSRSKLEYKRQSLREESRLLKSIWSQLRLHSASMALACLSCKPSSGVLPPLRARPMLRCATCDGVSDPHEDRPHGTHRAGHCPAPSAPHALPTPTPQFFWISEGRRTQDGGGVVAVAMEMLEGMISGCFRPTHHTDRPLADPFHPTPEVPPAWNCKGAPNRLSLMPNLGPDDLMPRTGLFASEPWRSRVAAVLHGCLAFNPACRWTFHQLERYLIDMHSALLTAYVMAKRRPDARIVNPRRGPPSV